MIFWGEKADELREIHCFVGVYQYYIYMGALCAYCNLLQDGSNDVRTHHVTKDLSLGGY